MADRTAARIAVIADTSLQRHVLQQALSGSGYQVVLNSDPARLDEAALADCETDLWLVDLAQSEDSPLVDNLLEKASAPVPDSSDARVVSRAARVGLPLRE